MINNDNIINDNSQTSKRQKDNNEDDNIIKRGSRSKNFKVFNQTVSQRDTMFVKAQNKKISKQKIIIKTFIFMIKLNDDNHEKIVFINNDIKKSMYALYRKIEEMKLITHL